MKKSGETAENLHLSPKHKGVRNLKVEYMPVSTGDREQTQKLLKKKTKKLVPPHYNFWVLVTHQWRGRISLRTCRLPTHGSCHVIDGIVEGRHCHRPKDLKI